MDPDTHDWRKNNKITMYMIIGNKVSASREGQFVGKNDSRFIQT
jgi:hypothetical protein